MTGWFMRQWSKNERKEGKKNNKNLAQWIFVDFSLQFIFILTLSLLMALVFIQTVENEQKLQKLHLEISLTHL